MENDPREMELNFSTVNEENSAVNSSGNFNAAEAEEKPAADVGSAESSYVSAAAVNLADVPRSQLPANCPAGTLPLGDSQPQKKISAAELAVAGKSYGTALRMLREYHQFDYKAIEQATLIQTRYLEALENENLEALPPLAFVIGYIRSLCSFYKLTNDTTVQLVAKLKEQLEYSCNDAMINSLDVDSAGEEVNAKRMKNIVWGFAGVVGLVAVLIIGCVLIFSGESKPKVTVVESPAGERQHFDPNTIYPLLEPPTLDLPKLPVAE